MRVRRIAVTKLFGIFDHDIPLNQDERITIIHSPNGYGKTVLLQMMEALFTRRWSYLRSVPFNEFSVEFDDGIEVRVTHGRQAKGPKDRSQHDLVFNYCKGGVADGETFIIPHDARSTQIADLLRRLPARLDEILGHIALRLISTQRLDTILEDGSGTHAPTVEEDAQELAQEIRTTLAAYASRSQELDSTFPTRLFEQGSTILIPIDTIRERLMKLEEERTRLTRLGFLDPERDAHRRLQRIDESKLDVLSVYVHDSEQKFAVFKDLASRIELLMNIVNRRFKYKRMSISNRYGFLFTSMVDDGPLALTSLSSGEQHELVLLYELLFRVKPDSLILIDEPEISLHLAWQQQFLDDLIQMVKLSAFDVVLATHSPSIIGKRWDLTVELKGPAL